MRQEAERDARLLALIATGTRGDGQQIERAHERLVGQSKP